MFKKGVITDEISQEIKVAAELATRYHLDGVEIRSVFDKAPHLLEKQDIKEIKAVLDGSGLSVCNISAPFFKCELDSDTEYKEQIDILHRCIALGQELGTNCLRGFTFWAHAPFEEKLDEIVAKFEEPIKILEKENAMLLLEFDPSVYASCAAKTVEVLKKINSPSVKALWDPGNDIYAADNEVPYPDGYEIIKPYIAHIHLKDAKKFPDGTVKGVPVGEGDVDFKGQLKRLIEDDYNGWVVLETHYRPSVQLDEKILARPAGNKFSYMGYEGSEECLIKWYKMLEELGVKA